METGARTETGTHEETRESSVWFIAWCQVHGLLRVVNYCVMSSVWFIAWCQVYGLLRDVTCMVYCVMSIIAWCQLLRDVKCMVYCVMSIIAWCQVYGLLRDVKFMVYCVMSRVCFIAWCQVYGLLRDVNYCVMSSVWFIAWCQVYGLLRDVNYCVMSGVWFIAWWLRYFVRVCVRASLHPSKIFWAPRQNFHGRGKKSFLLEANTHLCILPSVKSITLMMYRQKLWAGHETSTFASGGPYGNTRSCLTNFRGSDRDVTSTDPQI